MHREVWKNERGPIPDGYEVHHIDRNTGNNAIENLACISPLEHADIHAEAMPEERRQELKARMEIIRPLTKEWHASAEGREWHRQHALKMGFGSWDVVTKGCDQCGKSYETQFKRQSRFCSNNCKSASRRKTGKDIETRACAFCNDAFECSKYMPTKCCSGSCARKLVWRIKKSAQ